MNVPGPGGVDEQVEVDADPAGDGLVVYELPWELGRWVVGLASNGWRISTVQWSSSSAAHRYAETVAGLADWTADPLSMPAQSGLRAAVDAAATDLPERIAGR